VRSRAINARAQARLLAAARRAGWPTLKGRAQPQDSSWEAEESLLILGLRRAQAARLGRQFQQNAIVYLARHQRPELVFLW